MVRSETHALSSSLSNLRSDLLTIVRAGIAAAGAMPLTEQALALETESLEHVRVISAGKAAHSMAEAAVRVLGTRLRGGLVVAPAGTGPVSPFTVVHGGHPWPTPGSVDAGRHALALAESLRSRETLLVLLSGGASALMVAPADGISLDDKRRTTDRLLKAGADIHALNTVRKHLSGIKGGWLAARANGPCRTLAVSDVVGDDLSVIGSGPTVADATRFVDALQVLTRLGGVESYPPGVVAHLTSGLRGAVPETPKPGDPRLSRTTARVIGGRADAMSGAVREASARGYHVVQLDEPVIGEARVAAVQHLQTVLARASHVGRPACIVSSGETTVHVTGHGVGGRNQEFALALAEPLASVGVRAIVASVGTDGIDGPTGAAGAIVDSTTRDRANASRQADAAAALADNDAYPFFEALQDLIVTGPTDTNVGDLQIVLLA